MAIAFDASASGNNAGASSLTIAHTCTGSDRLLLVGVFCQETPTSYDVVTGVTYNGVAMTQLAKIDCGIAVQGVYLYGLLAPATGANNIVVSASTTTDVLELKSLSYTGVKQSGLPDASDTSNGALVTSISNDITTILDNCWAVMWSWSERLLNATAGVTARLGANSQSWIGDSNGVISPAGSFTGTLSLSSANRVGAIMVSFAPPASGPANVKTWDGLALASVKTIDGLAIASVKTIDGLN